MLLSTGEDTVAGNLIELCHFLAKNHNLLIAKVTISTNLATSETSLLLRYLKPAEPKVFLNTKSNCLVANEADQLLGVHSQCDE